MQKEALVDTPIKVSWEALTYFNFYRFLVAFLFVSLYWIGQLPEPLGEYDQKLFGISSHVYLLVTIGAQLVVRLRTPPFVVQVAGNVIMDIVILTTLMYSSAGLNSGFGVLLIIAVAGGSILSSGKIAILYASITTISVLGHEVYMQLQQFGVPPNYTHAGFLGISFFATALIGQALARRVEVSEALAEERAMDLENLAVLNEHIVQRLQSGIVVLDDRYRIILANTSATQLLGGETDLRYRDLKDISEELYDRALKWSADRGMHTQIVSLGIEKVETQISFVQLQMEKKFEVLIFMEDVSTLRQRAQQLKLASLGRLTASIAHEIRNPLGAISHAGQLLKEESLADENRRLTTIIDEQSRRVNNIIENVLSISRREQAEPTVVRLDQWLQTFCDEFRERQELNEQEMVLDVEQSDIFATMDPGQLHQVLWNLCENGLRYSTSNPLLKIQCRLHRDADRPFIDVIDTGTGIPKKQEEQLFEPFFTTSDGGSGLGLYIARELCEANQASLNLQSNSEQGCCFRIYFSHPEKQHNIM